VWDFVRRTLLCTLAAAALLTGCGKPRQAARMLTVQTAAISEASFSPNIEAISVLESTTNVALMPETDGRVVKVLAKDGQQVKAGQPILVLDNVQESAALDAAQAQARTDKLNAERYEFLYQNGAASAKQRDQYATQAIASRDKARSAAANLGYKFVRAPIDGVIGDLDTVKLGDYVKTGQQITGIVNNSTLWTLMQIPATQAGDVAIGQTVTVVSQGQPPVKGEGSVVFISPYFGMKGNTSAPNTLMVKAEFPNLTGQLKTGQYVKSAIITGRKQSLAVPVQAVMMQAEQPFVYRLVPLSKALPKIKASATVPAEVKKKLEKLPSNTPIVVQTAVQLGQLQNNLYPVKSGLNRADVVAVSNTSRLRSGMPVKVAPAGSTSSSRPSSAAKD
jgi:RND family efflux transporter MFP subunit